MKRIRLDEFENMTEEELKQRYVTIDEELKIAERNATEIKGKLLADLNKEGPSELTKELFSGTTIQPSRISILSETVKVLQDSKETIKNLLKEKKRKRMIESFAGDIKNIEITPGSMGPVMTVTVR